MYTLLSGLWQHWFTKPSFNLILLGLDGSGKTTLLEQLKAFGPRERVPRMEKLQKIAPTVGLNIGRVPFAECNLVVWDLGGKEDLRPIQQHYFAESNAVVFVVDSADAARMKECRTFLEEISREKELRSCPFLLLLNKQDLPAAIHMNQVCQFLHVPTKPHSASASNLPRLDTSDRQKSFLSSPPPTPANATHRGLLVSGGPSFEVSITNGSPVSRLSQKQRNSPLPTSQTSLARIQGLSSRPSLHGPVLRTKNILSSNALSEPSPTNAENTFPRPLSSRSISKNSSSLASSKNSKQKSSSQNLAKVAQQRAFRRRSATSSELRNSMKRVRDLRGESKAWTTDNLSHMEASGGDSPFAGDPHEDDWDYLFMDRPFLCVPISAIKRQGLDEGVEWLVHTLQRQSR